MKFDRYLMLDAEHDHEVGKLMPKLKVISGFTKENIENVFGINNKWIPKNNEKLFFEIINYKFIYLQLNYLF